MLEGLDLSPILVESANWLDCPFVKKEGHKPVFQLGKAKVPNLKNFSIITFQECWDVIKENLLWLFMEFYNNDVINHLHSSCAEK